MSDELRASYTDTFKHAFDAKGRITVPSEWRDASFESRLILLPSTESCIRVYPASWMSDMQRDLKGRVDSDPVKQQFQALASIAQSATWDQQGRIMVKEWLRKESGITKDAALVGKSFFFEIWDKATWEKKQPVKFKLEEALRAMGK